MTQETMKLALEGAANYIDALGGDSRKYRQTLANEALDKMAENARELGLDYEPDWKAEYQKAVELHCITLDELREARAEIKAQDAMLTRQTARIVDLQTHIENFDGEDR